MNNKIKVNSAPDFRMRDRLNGWTGLFSCRFLEWSGWYTAAIQPRLIGHYRLFRHFKKDFDKYYRRDIPATRAYILQYRSYYPLKNFICRALSFIFSVVTIRNYSPTAEYAAINRHLIFERPDILQQFLTDAEVDLDMALQQAIQQIASPTFLNRPAIDKPVFIQYNHNQTHNQYNDNHPNIEYNYNYTKNESHSNVFIQPVLRDGAKGKEKDVFSKKQTLLLFDLLTETSALERIDFDKKNKFEDIAALLHAITGKSKASFLEELADHHNKDLYHYQEPGERDQLIRDLTNLAKYFRAAGFRSITQKAEKKIKELEARKNP